ncbi:unnamed protein product [Toxocara canis]|uniref:RWD domain-containing protein n=1 Tax=Toxocara canis TaxID=6265 RepID=A0A183UVA2_TOXCA|nr:unnamed protein product [Toxocara canis]
MLSAIKVASTVGIGKITGAAAPVPFIHTFLVVLTFPDGGCERCEFPVALAGFCGNWLHLREIIAAESVWIIMAQEEAQAEELEALEAIYAGEIEFECRQYPNIAFRINLHSHSYSESEGRAAAEMRPQSFQVTLVLRLSAEYPDVIPDIELFGLDGLFTEERIQRVIRGLLTVAEENVGMPMAFTVVSALQDHMCSLVEEKNMEKERDEEKKKEEEEALAKKKFEGTRVTTESFMAWKRKFDAEMRALKEKEIMEVDLVSIVINLDLAKAALAGKLSGRQLFLRDATLSLSDVALMQSDTIEIDESLFEEELEGLDMEDSDKEA